MKGVDCKFSMDEIYDMIELWECDNVSQTDIAKMFNTSRQYISIILNRYKISKVGIPGPVPKTREELISIFHNSYVIRPYGCWEWSGRLHNGYGRLGKYTAHRFLWELYNEPIPEGMQVLHKCDNRKCVCPTHLYLGDDSDNGLDRKAIRYKIDDVKDIEYMYKECKKTPKNQEPKLPGILKKHNISMMTLHRMRHSTAWPCYDGVYRFTWES